MMGFINISSDVFDIKMNTVDFINNTTELKNMKYITSNVVTAYATLRAETNKPFDDAIFS